MEPDSRPNGLRASSDDERPCTKGRIAGAIGLIARRGKVGSSRLMDFNKSLSCNARDTIFAVLDDQQPITGVAVLTLYEEESSLCLTALEVSPGLAKCR